MAKIENLDKLFQKLDNIQDMKAYEDCMEQACILVENQAKINCPVDTGQLRQSITHDTTVENNELVGIVGTNVEYAPYVEYGTGIFAVKGDGRKDRWSYQDAEGNWHSTIGQRPQPFLEPALDSKRKDIRELFKNQIKKGAKGK